MIEVIIMELMNTNTSVLIVSLPETKYDRSYNEINEKEFFQNLVHVVHIESPLLLCEQFHCSHVCLH